MKILFLSFIPLIAVIVQATPTRAQSSYLTIQTQSIRAPLGTLTAEWPDITSTTINASIYVL